MSLKLPIGTRSLLYGAHQFLLHPLCLAIAWTKLYGFPRDVRLWVAFFVHDLGYWGKHDMDGEEGETHPELGSKIMGRLFDAEWARFALYHSRFYAKRSHSQVSRLCIVDKMATALVPWWLYLPMVKATGEMHGYMAISDVLGTDDHNPTKTARDWHRGMQRFLVKYVEQHKNLPEITMPQFKAAA